MSKYQLIRGIMETIYTDYYRKLGLNIAYYRKLAGFTQESFADKVGISVNYIAQIEAPGVIRGVSLETLFKMASVLNIEPSKLLYFR